MEWDGYNDAIVLEGSGNFNVNWRVDIEDGSQFHFNSSRDYRTLYQTCQSLKC
ncbi:hypothetical protein vBKpnAMK6_00471 [Klebsiella phage vB_Kpn_AM_K6]